MAEKISLAHRLFEQNRRFFVHHHPGATSTFRCPRCEYPVLIDRDATGFHAQCACIESGCEDLSEVPETPRQWLELMGQPAKEIVVCFPQDLTATIELITYPESLESHQLRRDCCVDSLETPRAAPTRFLPFSSSYSNRAVQSSCVTG
jgi:hypothetical protein